jgi:hypothetical protein
MEILAKSGVALPENLLVKSSSCTPYFTSLRTGVLVERLPLSANARAVVPVPQARS